MFKLLVHLELIRLAAKQLHYNVSGSNFYSDHLLMDRIQEELIDFEDEIKENYYMANGEKVPPEKEISSTTANLLPINISMEDLQEFLMEALNTINDLSVDSKDAAEQDLLGKISSNLANSLGLLNNRLKI